MKTFRNIAIVMAALAGPAVMIGCTATDSSRGTGEVVDDASLTARVKAALIKDPQVSGTAINVDTYRGVVQLSGFIESEEMARKAVQAAQQVNGVRSVKNNLQTRAARG